MKIGIFSRLNFPDSFANFFLVAELAFIEPERAFFDLQWHSVEIKPEFCKGSSSINEYRSFKIVLKRSPTVDVQS